MKYKARIYAFTDSTGNIRYRLSYVSQQDGQRIESTLEARKKDDAFDEAARQLDIRIGEIEFVENSYSPWWWGNSGGSVSMP